MISAIADYKLATFEFPRDRVIGDAQVAYDTNWVGALELIDDDGTSGLGFFLSLQSPLPSGAWLSDSFGRTLWPQLKGVAAETAVHRVRRLRGGKLNGAAIPQIDTAIDQALWDLAAKRADLPLHRYLGAVSDVGPRAYFSGLEFHLSNNDTHALYRNAIQRGYSGVKIKLGHPDIGEDLARLDLVRDAIGPDPVMMIDANESWTVSETLRRVDTFQKAGHALHWVEDPILRTDVCGLKALRNALSPVMVNAGEYLNVHGKMGLITNSACDIINLDGNISDGLRLAWLAADSSTILALGNSTMNVAAHLGAALPSIDYVEDAALDTERILTRPMRVEDGRFVLSNVPGHGLTLSESCEDYLA
jgi:L-alanine-DL-glutamate epimerase-like enolase superfamily enzyme